MWKADYDECEGSDLTGRSVLFAKDAFIRNEHVEIYDLCEGDLRKMSSCCGVGSRLFWRRKVRIPPVRFPPVHGFREANNVPDVRGDADNCLNSISSPINKLVG